MTLRTMQEYLRTFCGPCPPALTSEPQRRCESKTASASSADDDHTDDLAEWQRKKYLFDAHEAWLIADPQPAQEPPDEPDPGAEPEPPEGYGDVEHGSWAPFTQPAGDPGDDMPTLYQTLASESGVKSFTGSVQRWQAASGDGYSDGSATWYTWTAADTEIAQAFTAWRYTYGDDIGAFGGYTVGPLGQDESTGFDFPTIGDGFVWIDVEPPETVPCTATTREILITSRHAVAGGSASDGHLIADSLNSSEGADDADPTGYTTADDWQWTDLTERVSYKKTLASPVTQADVIARATGKLPAEWPDPAAGAACSSSVVLDWPKISAGFEGADPEAEPPVAGAWLACDSLSQPLAVSGSATIIQAQYQIGIPDTESYAGYYDAHAAWVIAHAAWVIDPEEPEPAEPAEGKYYRWQGDEVFFPTVWDAWKVRKDAFDAAIQEHNEWADGDMLEPEPIIPADPGAAPAEVPTLTASRSWLWEGGAPWSEMFIMAIPTIPGKTRLVNQLSAHFTSAARGSLPTAFGEVYEI